MSFYARTLCIASQRVFIVVYFVIDSVQKLLNTPSFNNKSVDDVHAVSAHSIQPSALDGLHVFESRCV
jgi:hypothetical protein